MAQTESETGATILYIRETVREMGETVKDMGGKVNAINGQIPAIVEITKNLAEAMKKMESGLDRLQNERVQSIDMRLGQTEVRTAQHGQDLSTMPTLRTAVATNADRIDRLQRVVYGALAAASMALLGVVIQLIFKGI